VVLRLGCDVKKRLMLVSVIESRFHIVQVSIASTVALSATCHNHINIEVNRMTKVGRKCRTDSGKWMQDQANYLWTVVVVVVMEREGGQVRVFEVEKVRAARKDWKRLGGWL